MKTVICVNAYSTNPPIEEGKVYSIEKEDGKYLSLSSIPGFFNKLRFVNEENFRTMIKTYKNQPCRYYQTKTHTCTCGQNVSGTLPCTKVSEVNCWLAHKEEQK